MAKRKVAREPERISLKLSPAQWKLLADPKRPLPEALAGRFAGPPAATLEWTYSELDELHECLADEHDNCPNAGVARRLLALCESIDSRLHAYQHLAPARPIGPAAVPDTQRLHRVRIALLEVDPPIWREILVKDCTLAELHGHIQNAMGWEDAHLHEFVVGRRCYGDPAALDVDVWDSRLATLAALSPDPLRKRSMRYQYDFGDDWIHEVLVEGGGTPQPGQKYPQCVDGARRCPPEDCGGIDGYEEMIDALDDPGNPERGRIRAWLGRKFDPEEFSAAATTKRMQRRR